MAERRVDVFFYGLFMDAELLRSKGADPQNIRRASLGGFALRIGQRATLVRTANARSYGVLMALTHAEIALVYSEPSVSIYRPEAVVVELADGSSVPALCFNLVVPPAPQETNADYAAKLRALGARLGLPRDYVENIR